MKTFAVSALALILVPSAFAQMQLPPGTSSSVPESNQQQRVSPETAALQRAEAAIGDNKFEDAVAVLTPMATAGQKNERVFYDLGFAQDALGHDSEATSAYRSAIALDGTDAAARVSLGLLLARDNNPSGAEEQLKAATKLPGADPALLARSYRALAQIHQQADPSQASDDLLAALKLTPETPEDAALAGQIAEVMQDDDEAAKAYARALQHLPGDADVSVGYARVLSRKKNFAEAEKILTAAQSAHPQNRAIAAELAAEQLLQGHAAEAVPILSRMHDAEPGDAAIGLLLARAYAEAELPDKADELYQALLAASPNDPVLLAEGADALIRQKRSPEAEPLLLRAMEHKDGFPTKRAMADAAGELAFASSSNHNAAVTLAALQTRETVVPLTAPFTFLRATAHDTLRHTKEAAEAYRLFLQQSGGKFPDQEWQAQQRLKLLDRAK